MKYLIVTDTHCKEPDFNIRLFSAIKEAAIREEVDAIIHLGDVFQERASQTMETLKSVQKGFNILCRGFPTYVIYGNHDKTNLTSNDSWLDFINVKYTRFFLIKKPTSIGRLDFLPFYDEPTIYARASELNDSGNKVLFTHLNFVDFGSNRCINQDHEVFDQYDLIISGDIHNSYKKGKVYQHPSAVQASYGEDEIKGYSIIEDGKIIKGPIELLPATYKSVEVRSIAEIDNVPEGVRIVYKGKDQAVLSAIQKAKGKTNKVVGDYVHEEIKIDKESEMEFVKEWTKKEKANNLIEYYD